MKINNIIKQVNGEALWQVFTKKTDATCKFIGTTVLFSCLVILSGCSEKSDSGSTLSALQSKALDRFMITELIYRYALAHNTLDSEAYASLFTEDALMYDASLCFVFAEGREQIFKRAEKDRHDFETNKEKKFERPKELSFGKLRHSMTNPVISLTSDTTAEGVVYVSMIGRKPEGGPVLLSHGYYIDEFEKQESGEWLFSKRFFHTIEWTDWEQAQALGLVNDHLPEEKSCSSEDLKRFNY